MTACALMVTMFTSRIVWLIQIWCSILLTVGSGLNDLRGQVPLGLGGRKRTSEWVSKTASPAVIDPFLSFERRNMETSPCMAL